MKIFHLFNFIHLLFSLYFVIKFLHISQLKNYNTKRYLHFFKSWFYLYLLISISFIPVQIFVKSFIFYITLNLFILIVNFIISKKIISSKKTPLVITKRIKQQYSISFYFLLFLCFFKWSYFLFFPICFLCPILSSFFNFSNKITNKKLINQAREKLFNSGVKIIAITGSNGKTSVKNILLEMLKSTHKTQATPASYNTPLGISKFINESLSPDTKYLILEYGARRKKDIKILCNLFGADYGIVTTIAPQHIETFKSIENVFKAKNQLPIFLKNKPCVFNIDNLYCLKMLQSKQEKNLSVSTHQPADVYAKNIKIVDGKTEFDLMINSKLYHLATPLLGEHNILNICLSVCLSKKLNVSNSSIFEVIKNLTPIEHRLQLIKTHINIIDDSYNCSLASAKSAVEVLSSFEGKKMIATPGIIECGKQKYSINFELGKLLHLADYVIIIGNENKKAILDGLKSQPNSMPKIYFSKDLENAKTHFNKLKPNETLLLLNDLPDDYS